MIDWEHPQVWWAAPVALGLLLWFDARSTTSLGEKRRRWLLIVRALLVLLALAAMAGPARVLRTQRQAVVFVVDESDSMAADGKARAWALADQMRGQWPDSTAVGAVSAGAEGRVRVPPQTGLARLTPPNETQSPPVDGSQTNLASAVTLAESLFPAGASRHVVIVSDGQENRGSLEEKARTAAVTGLKLHSVALAGEARPDVRLTSLVPSQNRLNEGATVDLTATVESSMAGTGRIRLFENGLQVSEQPLTVSVGQTQTVRFSRTPDQRNAYSYRAIVEGVAGDALPENNEALALVDVRGKPLILYIEGESDQAYYLTDAMAREGLRLVVRTPESMPQSLRELAGYDAVVISDVPAHKLGERWMAAAQDYVGKMGGGLVMIGGMNSFGVGGYYRTPIEELLPVKLKAPDQEEQQSSALALVMDRSGSMSGQKLEFCKSAAIATAELLSAKDFLGVYAFDSQSQAVVPMSRVPEKGGSSLTGPINNLTAGGGTNIMPGIVQARAELAGTTAKIKHMIVLTDGQSEGTGYEQMAASCRAEGITISTVAVGNDASMALLQAIASNGGGQAYQTLDPASITRIFTQDTMVHTGRLIREEAFQPRQVERHPILKNWTAFQSPPLLGYVKTNRKATAQVPLVTDLGEPLLAHWRYELGKVTAFTSDCKSRWAASWVTSWPGYSQFWAQLLRETARSPQGQNMDLALTQEGDETVAEVQVLEDAGTFRNDATVEADLFFLPANALGAAMTPIGTQRLSQEGAGRYRTTFRPEKPGVYLVRARSGAQMVSAGHVHNPSAEAATGRANETLLEKVATTTGGRFFAANATDRSLPLTGEAVARYAELRPWLIALLIALFFVDLGLRRWEHVRHLIAWPRRLFLARAR